MKMACPARDSAFREHFNDWLNEIGIGLFQRSLLHLLSQEV